jgi:hypothetical protein
MKKLGIVYVDTLYKEENSSSCKSATGMKEET